MGQNNNDFVKRFGVSGLILFCIITLVMPSEEYLLTFPILSNIGAWLGNIPNIGRYIASSDNQLTSIAILLVGTIYCVVFSLIIIFKLNLSNSPLETGEPIELKFGVFDVKIKNTIPKYIVLYFSFIILFMLFLYIFSDTSLSFDTQNTSRKAAGNIAIFKYLRSFIIGEGVLIWLISMTTAVLVTIPFKFFIYKINKLLS